MTSQPVTVVNQLGHARARGGEVRPPRDALPGARPRGARRRARWTARASWASCCSPPRAASTITISGRRRRRAATPSTALAALVAVGVRRGRMQRLTGIGVSPGVVSRPRGRPDPARAGAALPDRAGARRARARAARRRAAAARASSCIDIRARVARRRGPELASLFDAQLLMLDDPMLRAARRRHRPRAARQRRVGGPAGVRRVQRGLRRGRRSVPARAQGRRRRPRRPPADEPAAAASPRRATCCASSTSRRC